MNWGHLHDVVVDARGRYVIATEHEEKLRVACLTASFEPVWQSDDLPVEGKNVRNTRLSPGADGGVLVWLHARHGAFRFDDAGRMILIDPQGQLLHMSAAQTEWIERERAERQKKIAADQEVD